jgi:hypothetical protein
VWRRALSLDRQALMPLVVAVLLVGLFAPTASAAPRKPYEVTLTPAQVPAGVTVDGYTVTLTNRTQTQQLGSANVTAPTELTLEGMPTLDRPGSTVTRDGDLLLLRDLSLPPGESVTVTVGVRMTCVAGDYDWSFQAKQSNDFSGTPGNDLGPIEGSRITAVTDACVLRFVDQPANAAKNAAIRKTAYAPTSGEVTVEAVDGSPNPQRLDWFEGSITMGLAPSSYLGRLDPGTPETADDGLASFGALRIDLNGFYNLRATVPGFVVALSARFTIADIAEPCDTNRCRTELSGSRSTSTLTGAAGTDIGAVVLSLNLGPEPICAEYTPPPSSDWYEFDVTAARDKTIDVAYTRQAMKAFGKGKEALEICFAAPTQTPFPVKGAAEPFDYDGDSTNGQLGFVGLLPDCTDFSSPCITVRESLGNDGAQISFFVPDGLGDPRFH